MTWTECEAGGCRDPPNSQRTTTTTEARKRGLRILHVEVACLRLDSAGKSASASAPPGRPNECPHCTAGSGHPHPGAKLALVSPSSLAGCARLGVYMCMSCWEGRLEVHLRHAYNAWCRDFPAERRWTCKLKEGTSPEAPHELM